MRKDNISNFKITLNPSKCIDEGAPWHGEWKRDGKEALELMADVLRAYGMDVTIDYATKARATVTIHHVMPDDAWRHLHRGGGRPRDLNPIIPSECGGTYAEWLDWLQTHDVDEGRAVMGGVSRRTYYRRIAEIKKLADAQRQ